MTSALLREDRPATVRRAAVAGEPSLSSRRVALLEDVLVVVRELVTGSDVAHGRDPDAPVLDDRVAVRITRVIDEPRLVAVDRRVDDDIVVNGEEERVMPLAGHVGVPRLRLRRC